MCPTATERDDRDAESRTGREFGDRPDVDTAAEYVERRRCQYGIEKEPTVAVLRGRDGNCRRVPVFDYLCLLADGLTKPVREPFDPPEVTGWRVCPFAGWYSGLSLSMTVTARPSLLS